MLESSRSVKPLCQEMNLPPGDSFISRALHRDLAYMNMTALGKHNADYLEQIRLIPSCFVPIPRIMQLDYHETTELKLSQHSDVTCAEEEAPSFL